tara:strand:- start:449 stop:730 length:282 start_codon:yes stop_codon:yes gene_type:complete
MNLTSKEITTISSILQKADGAAMKTIVDMFNEARKIKNSISSIEFQVGQNVYFINKKAGRIEGKIVKKLRTNIQLKTSAGQLWRVTPSLLKRA